MLARLRVGSLYLVSYSLVYLTWASSPDAPFNRTPTSASTDPPVRQCPHIPIRHPNLLDAHIGGMSEEGASRFGSVRWELHIPCQA